MESYKYLLGCVLNLTLSPGLIAVNMNIDVLKDSFAV